VEQVVSQVLLAQMEPIVQATVAVEVVAVGAMEPLPMEVLVGLVLTGTAHMVLGVVGVLVVEAAVVAAMAVFVQPMLMGVVAAEVAAVQV
jgi:hypothetical protein